MNKKRVIVVSNHHKAFTVIEILVAMLLLFMAVIFSNIAIQSFNNYQKQSTRYQNFFITALSLKEKMQSYEQLSKPIYKGKLNGIVYSIEVKELIKKRNYIVSQDGIGRYDGKFLATLYELKMKLMQKNHEKNYTFLLTKQRKLK